MNVVISLSSFCPGVYSIRSWRGSWEAAAELFEYVLLHEH